MLKYFLPLALLVPMAAMSSEAVRITEKLKAIENQSITMNCKTTHSAQSVFGPADDSYSHRIAVTVKNVTENEYSICLVEIDRQSSDEPCLLVPRDKKPSLFAKFSVNLKEADTVSTITAMTFSKQFTQNRVLGGTAGDVSNNKSSNEYFASSAHKRTIILKLQDQEIIQFSKVHQNYEYMGGYIKLEDGKITTECTK